MGGYGSTRWGWHTAKDTVEASPGLSIATLQKYSQIGAPWLAEDMLGAVASAPGRASTAQLLQALKASTMQLKLFARQARKSKRH
jgi:hypothetical protein